MSDIFDEVQEEVRKERWEQLWKKYGHYAVAAAAVVFLAVGGYRGWQAYQHHLSEQASDSFLAAQQLAQSGNLVAAESAFAKLAADAPSGYETVSKFAEAAVLISENKREAALALLRELAGNDDAVLASVARLQIGWIEADYAPKGEVQSVLEPLLGVDNPFRFAASEVLAYTALRTGGRDEAIAAYTKLGADASAPEGIRQRSQAIAGYLKANPDITMLPSAMVLPSVPSVPVIRPSAPVPSAPAPAAPVSVPVTAPAPAPPQETHPQ